MYDRQKYRKPLQHAQTSTFFQDYLDILERYCPKQTIHYETSGYEFRYVVNQHSEIIHVRMIF